MQPRPNNILAGDVYIFEADEIVGVVGGLKFQQIARRVLDVMLPKPQKSVPSAAPRATKTVAVPTPTSKTVSTSLTVDTAIGKKRKKGSRMHTPNVPTPNTKKVLASSVISKVMDIISAETDVNMSELVDDAAFDNLGVDSLLSLTISARFREDLEIDVSGTLFTDHTTIGSLKRYFADIAGLSASSESALFSKSDFDNDDTTALASGNSSSTPTTPPSLYDDDERPAKLDPTSIDLPAALEGDSSLPRRILGEEMGVNANEIPFKADLADMGLDSLMSLTVLSRLREELGQDFASTFLVTNPTLEDIENALGMRPQRKFEAAPRTIKRSNPGPNLIAATPQMVVTKVKPFMRDVSSCPAATSACLQGNANTATMTVFLIPDGSGSATSYVGIPKLGPHVVVYGLNCPFMKKPEAFVIGVDGVAQLFIREMKRRRPLGPYTIGGWSAGGVIAYEITHQLLAQSDTVDRLVLIDCPSPRMASVPLPPRIHHFFAEIGLLGEGTAASLPAWLLTHFEYAIKALSAYRAQRIDPALAPKTFAIWCRKGVCGEPGDRRPPPTPFGEVAPMKFLLDNRTDFGDNGWAELIPTDKLDYGVMDGNHFTMMQPEHSQALGDLIKQSLGLKT